VQIRLKGRKASETFIRYDHARERATETEAQIDRGHAPSGLIGKGKERDRRPRKKS
jgi:hypothetical protein